jgi:hypothetical protein
MLARRTRSVVCASTQAESAFSVDRTCTLVLRTLQPRLRCAWCCVAARAARASPYAAPENTGRGSGDHFLHSRRSHAYQVVQSGSHGALSSCHAPRPPLDGISARAHTQVSPHNRALVAQNTSAAFDEIAREIQRCAVRARASVARAQYDVLRADEGKRSWFPKLSVLVVGPVSLPARSASRCDADAQGMGRENVALEVATRVISAARDANLPLVIDGECVKRSGAAGLRWI